MKNPGLNISNKKLGEMDENGKYYIRSVSQVSHKYVQLKKNRESYVKNVI